MALLAGLNETVLRCVSRAASSQNSLRVSSHFVQQLCRDAHIPGAFLLKGNLTRSIHVVSPSLRCASYHRTLVSSLPNTLSHKPLLFSRRVFASSCLRHANKMNVGNQSVQKTSSTLEKSSSKLSQSAPKKVDVKRLLSLARPEKWKLAAAMGCLVVSSGVAMSVPFYIGKIIDLIYTSDKSVMMNNLNAVCAVLLGVFILGGLANFGRVYILQTSSQRMVKQLRENLFSRIIRQEMAFFDKTKTGELVNRLSTDTTVVAQSLSQNISDGLRSTFQACAGIGMMTYMSTKLTLISMCIVPPVALGSIVYGRYLRKVTRQVQDSLANATQLAEERIANIRTVRAFAQENRESEVYRQGVEQVLQLSYKESWARAIFWGFTGFSGNVIIISVFYFGGLMMLDSSITVGDLSAFLLYAAYVGVSMGGLTSFYTEVNRGIAASHRIWQLIDRQPQIELDHVVKSLSQPAQLEGDIRFHGVTFSYPSRPEAQIFSDLDLHIPAGSITAVVGPSGSGKSTLGSLLLRFYDPSHGNITLDGQSIQEVDPHWLRSHISTVSQEPILFSTTVAENIAYGSDDPLSVSREDILDAARKANAFNFVSSFPDGFDTLVGERGLMLSGGQRQRIAIARAILKNPKILILDEATSALDAESEHLVQEALERLMQGRTVLTIAHRLSTIKSADQIAVVDQGKVVENGSYSQLMDLSDGLFRRLVERQTIQSFN
ncbi:ATP-binding cassette sub-family B member 10, mitochondrial [Aplysia californica]|uniref:ATP-binding cassette sub-family B member 10, mitochondrial n=1 Tax=Aplysia californica TaxID=6500 RepID=A0ABM0JVY5_APLCA|nr:ATP-binding cassette sub-family B member 10, mitochondrial [Aplysia californica]